MTVSRPEAPLADVRVVEIGHSVAAPFCGLILAGLGADVLKIEHPGKGDDARAWGPPFVDGSAAVFHALNRDKRSAAIDLKDPGQRAALRTLILEQADVVVQNMRPGNLARYGLDAASLRAEKPRLVYANLGAYGRRGPLAERPGYDPLMQAFGGVMSITGEDGREPVRVGPSLIDQGTGMWAALGIVAALRRRELTGEGCEVDTSLFETALGWVGIHAAVFAASGEVPRRLGSENQTIAPYKAFRAADDWLIIAAGNDGLFRKLAAVLGRPALADEPAFRTNPDRVAHRERLNALVAEIVAGQPRAHWIEVLEAAGIPCAPLQSIDQVSVHPQTRAVGMLQALPGEELKLMGLPIQFDGVRPPYRSAPPRLGEHTPDEVAQDAAK
ncbi:MAG TPA: CoA transferase [Hyphomicrobiales bacterium]|nr:CoA transferase [Hyphomicrobiales bacterium]